MPSIELNAEKAQQKIVSFKSASGAFAAPAAVETSSALPTAGNFLEIVNKLIKIVGDYCEMVNRDADEFKTYVENLKTADSSK